MRMIRRRRYGSAGRFAGLLLWVIGIIIVSKVLPGWLLALAMGLVLMLVGAVISWSR